MTRRPDFRHREGADDVIGTDDDYLDLTFEFDGEEAYSYVFDGQSAIWIMPSSPP